MSNTAVLIPARYGSTRYPGKPLALLDGKTMIERVYETCKLSKLDTYVLTDNKNIAELFPKHAVYMDTADYENGTERCAGAVRARVFDDYDQFINVQGDMPDVTIEMIAKAKIALSYYSVGTVFTDMPKDRQDDPNSVKMIHAGDQALWFGRGMTGYGDWHLGVYSYTKNALQIYPDLIIPQEEKIENLEQLRWLKNGWQIGCYHVQFNGIEINTVEDFKEWHKQNSQ